MSALDPLRRLADWIDARARRERLLIAGTAVVVLLVAWELALRAPLSERRASALERADRLEREIDRLRASQASVEAELEAVEAGEGERTVTRLRERIEAVDERLTARTLRVVAPEEMVEVVRDVVAGDPDVRLVSLANAGVEPLIKEGKPAVTGFGADIDARHVPRVYRHSLEIVVRGRYLDVLGYLRRLEDAPWRFQWDGLEIETLDYPTARARIDISTLSFEEDWIGV